MAEQRRIRVVVSGRVQGVFFRATLRDTAEQLGLRGWVRNRRDGRLEAELQGDAASVERAVAVCREGPPHAHVADLAVEALEPVEGESGFQVR